VGDSRVVLSLDGGTTGATSVAVGMDGLVRGKGYATGSLNRTWKPGS